MPNPRDRFTVHARAVQVSLVSLDRAIRGLSGALEGYSGLGSSKASTSRRKLTITPARRAALKLQGQYMGYMRNLKPRQKAEVKAVKVKKGILAAIAAAKRMAKAA